MSDVVGRGTIELVGDARKLKASIEDAKKSIRTLGEGQKDISKSAQQSIDQYIGRLQSQNAMLGKSRSETELYKLALRGASNEQINSAKAALSARDAYARNAESVAALKTGFIAFFAIAVTGSIAAAAAFDQLVKQAAKFQDMGEKIGDSAEAVASLAVSAAVGGIAMDAVVGASAKLTKGLTGVDDESKAAGAAIEALGLDVTAFKNLKAADQMEAVAKALAGFEEGTGKTAVAMALFGKAGADMLPFLKELGKEGGRQTILTAEQIRLADEYADKQAKLRSQIGLHAESIIIDMLPAYGDLTGAFLDVIKGMSGMQDGAKGLGSSTGIQDFADNSVKTLSILLDSIDITVRGFQLIGTRIAAIAAQGVALASGDLKSAIATEINQAKRLHEILSRPLISQAVEARTAARGAAARAEPFRDNFDTDTQGRPKLKFGGAVKSGADTAKQEAKAQLAFDLEQIRKASDATIGTFANAEKIMEARRAANLVNDKDYYASKLGFLNLNSREQEAALQKEIERLEQEKLIGKDRIDNERKIVETRAKLAKVRADSVANIEINSIQEAAANQKLAQSYVDATEAADAYIASIVRRNQAEVDGIGRGAQFREVQAGRNKIEDTFTNDRQRLERDLRNRQITQETFDIYLKVAQDTYAQEIAAYEKRTADILAKSTDWTNGASEALNNYLNQTRDVSKQTQDLFTNAFQNMENALVDFVKTGKLDFKSLADSIITELIRIQVKKAMAGVMESASSAGGLIGAVAGLFKAASGGSFMVGGSGGTDSQFIPIMATPGERVTVETPAQQRAGGMVVIQNFAITGPVDRRSQAQIAAAAGEGVQRSMTRNT